MTIEIKHLTLEESIEILHFLNSYAFRPTPPLPDFEDYVERIRHRKGGKYYALFEGDQPLSICASIEFTQNIRGRILQMRGVANVATHPSARRKGYVRALMHHLYKEFQLNHIPVSCLYPFKEDFYQRMGYVTLPQAKKIRFDPRTLAPTLKMDLDGTVELLPFIEGQKEYWSFLETMQKETHGMAVFAMPQTYTGKALDYWLAVARQDEKILGIMHYNLTGQIMDQKLTAPDFLFINAKGKFLLLNWIARHIDQATQVELTLNPAIYGENLFTGIQPQFEGLFVAPMSRVVCVDALQGIPCGRGGIKIEITDSDCGWNNGIWEFSSDEGQLNLRKSQKADCTLTIEGLTGQIYGVYSPDEIVSRGWGNIDWEKQMRLMEMFPPAVPYLHETY